MTPFHPDIKSNVGKNDYIFLRLEKSPSAVSLYLCVEIQLSALEIIFEQQSIQLLSETDLTRNKSGYLGDQHQNEMIHCSHIN